MSNKETRIARQHNSYNRSLWGEMIAPVIGAIIFGVLRYLLDLPLWLVLPVMLITFYGVRVLRRR